MLRELLRRTAGRVEPPHVAPVAESAKVVHAWGDSFGNFATRCLQVIIVLVLATGVIGAGLVLKTEVIAVLLALILACAFSPLMRLLTARLHLPRTLAAFVTLILVLGGLAGVLTIVGFAVAGQARELSGAAAQSAQQIETFLRSLGVPIEGDPGQQLVQTLQGYVQDTTVRSKAISGLSVVGEVATGAALLIFTLFFFLRDGAKIWHFFTRPLRGARAARAQRIGKATVVVLGSYARGTATVAFVDALFIGIGLAVLGVPLALPLAVVVFITAFIPIIGAPIAGLLAAAVALVSQGPLVALIVIGIVVLVNQLENHLLQPLIMSRAVSLHPLAVLLSLAAGTILGGIVGAILAVPTASVTWAAIKAWRGEPVATRDGHAQRVDEGTDKKAVAHG